MPFKSAVQRAKKWTKKYSNKIKGKKVYEKRKKNSKRLGKKTKKYQTVTKG